MFRRRRRRSRFSSGGPPLSRMLVFGVAGAIFLGGFLFFFFQAESLAPAPQDMRIELPDAFKAEPAR